MKPNLLNFVFDSTSLQHVCYLCSVKLVFKEKAFDVREVQFRWWLIMQPSLAFLENDSPCAPTPILHIKVRFCGILLHVK